MCRFEVVLVSGAFASIQVAGIGLADDEFGSVDSEEAQNDIEDLPSDNLIVNADLLRWPSGIVSGDIVRRREVALGWHVFGPREGALAQARAIFSEGDDHLVAFALACDADVPCRLEIELEPQAARVLKGQVSLELGMPAAARRLLKSSPAASAAFSTVQRVLLIERPVSVATAKTKFGGRVRDRQIGVIARRLLVSRGWHTFHIDFNFSDAADTDENKEQTTATDMRQFLVLEFPKAFAIAVRGAGMVAQRSKDILVKIAKPTGFFGLEDRNIAAQLDLIVGLSASRHVAIAEPVLLHDNANENQTEASTWTWSALWGSVEIVVCVHDAIEETLACLRALDRSSRIPHSVRIIDDASSPTNAQRLRAYVNTRPSYSLVRLEDNRGYTYSADLGVSGSSANWVVLLNSDTQVTEGWLEGLLNCAASDPNIAMVGPLSNAASFQSVPDLNDAGGGWRINRLPEGWSPDDMARVVRQGALRDYPKVPLLNGFCTLILRSAYLEQGGLNTEAFPAGYGEENDLCLRMAAAGYSLAIADDVYVYHSKSASFGSKRRDQLSKQGGATLKGLHPEIDLALLTTRLRDTPALVRMRDHVRRAYEAAL